MRSRSLQLRVAREAGRRRPARSMSGSGAMFRSWSVSGIIVQVTDAALTKADAHRHVRDCRPLYLACWIGGQDSSPRSRRDHTGFSYDNFGCGGSESNMEQPGPGKAWRRSGEVRWGRGWKPRLRQGDQRSINESTWSGSVRQGQVRSGRARQGGAW